MVHHYDAESQVDAYITYHTIYFIPIHTLMSAFVVINLDARLGKRRYAGVFKFVRKKKGCVAHTNTHIYTLLYITALALTWKVGLFDAST